MLELLFKLLVIALTAPWWFPVVRGVWNEMWRVAEQREERAAEPLDYEALGWSPDRRHPHRLENARWTTGRRPVRRTSTSFRDSRW